MKILKLTFCNINSLAGTWSIDFENPAFAEGLFALTGPTGAGKTSVLDAICLALYGKTVREEISKDHNEVMTRGTGECHAEVTFEVDRRRYRCLWRQDRARRKPDGQLQNAIREIAELPQGNILASQLRQVDLKVNEITGMSFEQFTRAVLLAQGQFDTFLKAKDSDRADILEKITNTGIFSRIGAAVFSRFQEVKQKKEALELAQAGITVLTAEDRGELDAQMSQASHRRTELARECETLSQQLAQLNRIAGLQQEQARLIAQQTALDADYALHQPELERLSAAERARKMDPELQAIERARAAHAAASAQMAAREGRRGQSEAALQAVEPRLDSATRAAQTALETLDRTLPGLAAVRSLDQQIVLAQRDRDYAARNLADARESRNSIGGLQASARKKHAAAEHDLAQARAYQRDHAADGTIAGQLPDIEARYRSWQEQQVLARKAQEKAALAKSAADDSRAKVETARTVAQEFREAAGRGQVALEAALPRLEVARLEQQNAEAAKVAAEADSNRQRAELDRLHELAEAALRLAQQVASLEERRQQLVEGKPCPLCGAIEHPYQHGATLKPSVAEEELKAIKARKVALEQAVQSRQAVLETARNTLQAQQQAVDKLTRAREQAEARLVAATQALQSAVEMEATRRTFAAEAETEVAEVAGRAGAGWPGIANALAQWGAGDVSPERWAAIIERLHRRRDELARQGDIAISAEAQLEEAQRTMTGLEATAGELDRAIAEKQQDHAGREQALQGVRQDRIARFGEQVPDVVEREVRRGKERADQQLALIVGEKARLEEAARNARSEVDAAQRQLESARETCLAAEAAGAGLWQTGGFAGEVDCRSARWLDAEVERVSILRQALKERGHEIEIKRGLNEKALAEERSKGVTDRTALDLESALRGKEATRAAEEAGVKELEFRVRSDDANRASQKTHGEALDQQKVLYDRWKKMNEMIGTEGGVRFKKYAQGITLSRLLTAANPYLASMTNHRYAMKWTVNAGDALLPSIVDHHQADVQRPVSNLSGGETFMVSLALALGLSSMASGTLQVDSLFLDEGFGTLDNDALDRAIGTLNQLHQSQGKLIGVISHIDQLKLQIATKIEVAKVANGRSRLAGPGVERIVPAAAVPVPQGGRNEPAAEPNRGRRRGKG